MKQLMPKAAAAGTSVLAGQVANVEMIVRVTPVMQVLRTVSSARNTFTQKYRSEYRFAVHVGTCGIISRPACLACSAAVGVSITKSGRVAFPEDIAESLKPRYESDCYIFDVYDGDTVYYHADLGYNHWAAFQTGRLLDIDSPEIWPLVTRKAGERARNHLQKLLTRYALNRHDSETRQLGLKFKIRTEKGHNKWFDDLPASEKGKFGRWLVTLYGADNRGRKVNINQMMIAAGYAETYSGGS